MTETAENEPQQNQMEQEHMIALLANEECDWSEEDAPAPFSTAVLGYN